MNPSDERANERGVSTPSSPPADQESIRYGTIDIATLDERHFRAVRPLAGGKAFRLLPADA